MNSPDPNLLVTQFLKDTARSIAAHTRFNEPLPQQEWIVSQLYDFIETSQLGIELHSEDISSCTAFLYSNIHKNRELACNLHLKQNPELIKLFDAVHPENA